MKHLKNLKKKFSNSYFSIKHSYKLCVFNKLSESNNNFKHESIDKISQTYKLLIPSLTPLNIKKNKMVLISDTLSKMSYQLSKNFVTLKSDSYFYALLQCKNDIHMINILNNSDWYLFDFDVLIGWKGNELNFKKQKNFNKTIFNLSGTGEIILNGNGLIEVNVGEKDEIFTSYNSIIASNSIKTFKNVYHFEKIYNITLKLILWVSSFSSLKMQLPAFILLLKKTKFWKSNQDNINVFVSTFVKIFLLTKSFILKKLLNKNEINIKGPIKLLIKDH